MASYRTNTDPKAIENNYSKRLSIFANKLHQHTNVLKQQLSEMRRINTSLLGKLQQIRRLNNPMTLERSLAYFSETERCEVLTTVESEAGTELRRIIQISKDQKESIEDLQLDHKQLAAACVALEAVNIPAKVALNRGPMPTGVSPLYSGNSRQKSMNFYLSGSYKFLNEWDILIGLCSLAVVAYFPKFPKDFERFQEILKNLDSLIKSVDDYLMYCSFLINRT